jgi:hypothetical protein
MTTKRSLMFDNNPSSFFSIESSQRVSNSSFFTVLHLCLYVFIPGRLQFLLQSVVHFDILLVVLVHLAKPKFSFCSTTSNFFFKLQLILLTKQFERKIAFIVNFIKTVVWISQLKWDTQNGTNTH